MISRLFASMATVAFARVGLEFAVWSKAMTDRSMACAKLAWSNRLPPSPAEPVRLEEPAPKHLDDPTLASSDDDAISAQLCARLGRLNFTAANNWERIVRIDALERNMILSLLKENQRDRRARGIRSGNNL